MTIMVFLFLQILFRRLSVRAKIEHVFSVIKNLFSFRKTRYRGKRKQFAKLNILFALANLYLADKRFGLSAWLWFVLSKKIRAFLSLLFFDKSWSLYSFLSLYTRGFALAYKINSNCFESNSSIKLKIIDFKKSSISEKIF